MYHFRVVYRWKVVDPTHCAMRIVEQMEEPKAEIDLQSHQHCFATICCLVGQPLLHYLCEDRLDESQCLVIDLSISIRQMYFAVRFQNLSGLIHH
jgi:hypothetical protein